MLTWGYCKYDKEHQKNMEFKNKVNNVLHNIKNPNPHNNFEHENGEKDVNDEEMRKNFLKKLEQNVAHMGNIISGDDFSNLSLDELNNLICIGEGLNKYCYTLDTMYEYIKGYISQNKKQEIPNPMEEAAKGQKRIYLPIELIDEILLKYNTRQKKRGEKMNKIESSLKFISGTELGNPQEVYNSLYKKPFVRIVIEREGLNPFVIGYLPQDYKIQDADLEVYAIIGTIGDLFTQGKVFEKNSTINKLQIRKEFQLMEINEIQRKFMDKFYKQKKNATKSQMSKLFLEEEKQITDMVFKEWWINNPNWDGHSPDRYIINKDKLNKLAQGLIYLKYN